MNREVAVYKGDELLCSGTILECAKELGVLPTTIYFYLMPTYQRRLAKRKREGAAGRIAVVRLDEEDED